MNNLAEIIGITVKNRDARFGIINKISGAFPAAGTINFEKLKRLIGQGRGEIISVKLALTSDIIKLEDLSNDAAKQFARIFANEFALLNELQKEFFEKIKDEKNIDAKWVAQNIQIDKLVAIASKLVKERIDEQLVLKRLEGAYEAKAA